MTTKSFTDATVELHIRGLSELSLISLSWLKDHVFEKAITEMKQMANQTIDTIADAAEKSAYSRSIAMTYNALAHAKDTLTIHGDLLSFNLDTTKIKTNLAQLRAHLNGDILMPLKYTLIKTLQMSALDGDYNRVDNLKWRTVLSSLDDAYIIGETSKPAWLTTHADAISIN